MVKRGPAWTRKSKVASCLEGTGQRHGAVFFSEGRVGFLGRVRVARDPTTIVDLTLHTRGRVGAIVFGVSRLSLGVDSARKSNSMPLPARVNTDSLTGATFEAPFRLRVAIHRGLRHPQPGPPFHR
jgi:hypothetical protein